MQVLGIQNHKLFTGFSFCVSLASRLVYEDIDCSSQVLKKMHFGFTNYFPARKNADCGYINLENFADIIDMVRFIIDLKGNTDFSFNHFMYSLRIAVNYFHKGIHSFRYFFEVQTVCSLHLNLLKIYLFSLLFVNYDLSD